MAKRTEQKNQPSGRERVYKKIDLIGVSRNGIEDAIQIALSRSSETVKHLRWFEVKEIRGGIGRENAIEYQVVLQVAFEVE